MALPVMCLLCKTEGLSLIPGTQAKGLADICNLSPTEAGDFRGWL